MSIYDKASLVLIPSGTKTSKVYSQVPTNGDGDFTFSRSTAATRVNASGNIEKETQNLLLQSNTFNTTWAGNNTNVVSGQSGYDGSSDAWQLQAQGGYAYRGQSLSSNGVQTFSVYAKEGSVPCLRLYTTGSASLRANFDLSNGSVIDHQGIEAKIESAGNGYYRCSLTFNANSTFIYIYAARAGGDIATTTTGDNIYIQDAQLEQGLVARDYIETTTTAIYGGITDNVPRLDYTDSSCQALLLEPQRTNNIPYSEYQSGGAFSLGANITWNGFVESPEGYNNASRFTSSTTSASYVQINNVTIPAGDFTFSMWVRGVSGSFVNRSMYIPSHTGAQATMNEAPVAGEDWKLVYGSGTNTSGSSYVRTITLPFYDQPTGAVWEMYGFQLEAGSYATSYIPTYGSAVTRNRDLALTSSSITLATKNFTIFVDSRKMNLSSAGTLDISYKTGGGNVFMYGNCIGYSGGSGNEYYCAGTLLGDCKWAFVADYDAGHIKVFLNGSLVRTDTSINLSRYGLGQVELCYLNGMAQYKNLMTFPTALTDQEAIDLTTI